MGQEPDEIRQEIEQTRAEMSETVDAIGYKADVPSRAKEKVSEKVDNVKATVSGTVKRAKEAVTGTASRTGDAVRGTASRVGDATPSGGDAKRSARRVVRLAQENPLGLVIGAAALGFLAGLATPSTRVEDERLGPVADQVKDKARETGQEALARGRQVAQEATHAAVQTAKERGQEHGQELAESAKQGAEQAGSRAQTRTVS
jgi:gas vesicle protein